MYATLNTCFRAMHLERMSVAIRYSLRDMQIFLSLEAELHQKRINTFSAVIADIASGGYQDAGHQIRMNEREFEQINTDAGNIHYGASRMLNELKPARSMQFLTKTSFASILVTKLLLSFAKAIIIMQRMDRARKNLCIWLTD